MNFSSFQLTDDISSITHLRDRYLHRSALIMSEKIVSILKNVCNRVRKEPSNIESQMASVINHLKNWKTRQFISDHYNCGKSDKDPATDNFYHELDIFINLDIRMISHSCFGRYDNVSEYHLRTSYYQFIDHLFVVGFNVIMCESLALKLFMMGKNRTLVKELISAFREELVSFTPVPNINGRIYQRPQQPKRSSETSESKERYPKRHNLSVPTPRVRFQHVEQSAPPPSIVAPPSHNPLVIPTTARQREQFLDGANMITTGGMTGPPSPLQELMRESSQRTTLPQSNIQYKDIWLNSTRI